MPGKWKDIGSNPNEYIGAGYHVNDLYWQEPAASSALVTIRYAVLFVVKGRTGLLHMAETMKDAQRRRKAGLDFYPPGFLVESHIYKYQTPLRRKGNRWHVRE